MESASAPSSASIRGGNNVAGALSWDLWAARNWGVAPTSNAAAAQDTTHPSYHHQHLVTCAYAPPPTPLPFADSYHQQRHLPRHHYTGTGGYSTAADVAHHHLTCLKLGKRHYYEEGDRAAAEAAVAPAPGAGSSISGSSGKKEKAAAASLLSSSPSPSSSTVTSSTLPSSTSAVVPRCQVEGCNAPLAGAKDYHKRHKVCEAHSKAPKVVVLGLEQRFCQQCSRFHVISEFDDSKRSCRRRLAGHNERRRKSSNEASVRNSSFDYMVEMGGRFPYVSSSTSPGCALSLLSSEASPWSHSELSSQSSVALRELIAENRAALLARQLFINQDCLRGSASVKDHHFHQQVLPYHQHLLPEAVPTQLPFGWDHFRSLGSHVTINLKQVPSSSYEALSSRRSKSLKEDDEENCCGIWKSLAETHVV